MITLITGVPGSGKTLRAVFELEREVKAGRRLLVNGVSGLLLDHVLLSDDDTRRWQECVQPNDVLVIDEVQRIWPPVAQGTKPSPDVEALHVHRHMGVDVMVITQHPNRMNKTVRDLVGRHVHVRRLFGMRRAMVYEWDSAHNPNSGFRDATKTVWTYPKRVFDLYKSAELHTKPKAVIPKALFIVPLALVVGLVLAYRGFKGVHGGFGFAGAGGGARSAASRGGAGVGGAGTHGALVPASPLWRLAGSYLVDGRAYVVLSDTSGRFRVEPVDGFSGGGVHQVGVVDGERVAPWSGAGASGVVAAGAKR